jgi:hypothetical protein
MPFSDLSQSQNQTEASSLRQWETSLPQCKESSWKLVHSSVNQNVLKHHHYNEHPGILESLFNNTSKKTYESNGVPGILGYTASATPILWLANSAARWTLGKRLREVKTLGRWLDVQIPR